MGRNLGIISYTIFLICTALDTVDALFSTLLLYSIMIGCIFVKRKLYQYIIEIQTDGVKAIRIR